MQIARGLKEKHAGGQNLSFAEARCGFTWHCRNCAAQKNGASFQVQIAQEARMEVSLRKGASSAREGHKRTRGPGEAKGTQQNVSFVEARRGQERPGEARRGQSGLSKSRRAEQRGQFPIAIRTGLKSEARRRPEFEFR